MEISYEVVAQGAVLGTWRACCPHCAAEGELTRHALGSDLGGMALSAREALRCPACGKFSQRPSLGSRVMGVMVLAPALAMLASVAGGGVWMAVSMLQEGVFTAGLGACAAALVGVGGYLAWRTARRMRDLLSPSRLTPMDSLRVGV